MNGETPKKDQEFLYKELTSEILNSAFEVHNTLGCGLLEKVYENAFVHELKIRNLNVEPQKEFNVIYKNQQVGLYYADIIVDKKVIIEIKAVEKIENVHRAQMLNYMKISGIQVGLLINFANTKLEYERYVI